MRVLITGGYGFIGSFVAETFSAEGHDVYIIDNLVTGNERNVRIKHKFYNANVEDAKCEEIFQINKFDVVIHLAGQVNTGAAMDERYVDSKTTILGLTNMLHLSQKYGVKKVVYASSAAVYGFNENMPLKEDSYCDPMSSYGINKWVGELYCSKWTELFGIDTLCFRISNVYGPRMGKGGEGGVISNFIDCTLKGKELKVFGDGEQTRDFIYVQDVAEAIHRAVEYNLSGIYNLSTNTETSVNELIAKLTILGNVKEVEMEKGMDGDMQHLRLDNSKIKKELDWVPLYHFQEGLKMTYEWYDHHRSQTKGKKTAKKSPKWFPLFGSSISFLENMSIVTLAFLFNKYFGDSLYMVDFQLFYIVVASFLLGRNQAILSIGIGSIWFIYANILNGRELVSLIVDHNTLVHIGLYMFVGLTMSYILDKKGKMINDYRSETADMKEKHQLLNASYHELLQIKDELQNQVLYTNESFGTVYTIMSELDYLDPIKTYSSSVRITEKIMKSNEVAFYIVDQSQEVLRLVAKSDDLMIQPKLIIAGNQIFSEIKQTNKLFINNNQEQNLPAMVAPISIDGELIGLLCLYNIEFEHLTLFKQNTMVVVTKLISSALQCAYQHQDALISGKKNAGIPNYKKEEAYA